MSPMISVIVPVYNTEDYLPKCIDSILGQTYDDFELILVNDGSTDRSGLKCEEYAQKDNRIRVIHECHQGVSAARNIGLANAKGNYISFFDSDDFIHPDMLDKLNHYLVKYKADIAICNYQVIFENEEGLNDTAVYGLENGKKEIFVFDKFEALERMIDGKKPLIVYVWNKLYKKELFTNIKFPPVQIHEDTFTTYKILFNSEVIVYTTEQLYYYLKRKGSLSKKPFSLKNLDNLDALKEITDFFFNKELSDLYYKAAFRYLNSIILYYFYYQKSHKDDNFTLRRLLKRYRKEFYSYRMIVNTSYKKKFKMMAFFIHPKIHIAAVIIYRYYHRMIKSKTSLC